MRYLIGIDLGTTNSCVAYADTQQPLAPVQLLPIPQLIAAGVVEPRPMLPSFCYLAMPEEWAEDALSLPWTAQRDYAVGSLALQHGARVPTRLITAAKSWLCHSAAARRDPILPPGGEAKLRISPVDATARYLAHIADAWNWTIGRYRKEDAFELQEVILTVPASFDEVARALTAEAAKKAGYGTVTILEEPLAAFYCWIDTHAASWEQELGPDATVLVCDIGGGTTDFSLVKTSERMDAMTLERRAVGEHLLLGGDNIDAAIAHYAADRLEKGDELSSIQWLQLCHQCRMAKEQLLSGDRASYTLHITGTGQHVVEGSRSLILTRQELLQLTQDGFFGSYSWQEACQKLPARGIRTMGLPYEDESSISKHMAVFLATHGTEGKPAVPTHILFNGGTLRPLAFQTSLIDNLERWFGVRPQSLASPHFDSAVARGAAYYGKVRRGIGVRIAGGSPRSYYLAVGTKDGSQVSLQALTLVARGAEEGTTYTSEQTFQVTPNKPVSFELYTSHTRLDDLPGDLIAVDPTELHRLPPIHTILRYGKNTTVDAVPVQLQLTLTAIGTLELWLVAENSQHRWKLEFQLRAATGQEDTLRTVGEERHDVTYDAAHYAAAALVVTQAFTPGSGLDLKKLTEQLEAVLGMPRKEWPPSALRALWTPLLAAAPQRMLSSQHEERWWNLAGWLLRPGYGYPLDDFHIRELWKIILAELKRNKSHNVLQQQLICFRRVAGGLNRGQQAQIAAESLALLLPARGSPLPLTLRRQTALYWENLRAVAAMEWLDSSVKVRLGDALVARVKSGDSSQAERWALGRIAARQLTYAPLHAVVASRVCAAWLNQLLHIKFTGTSDTLLMVGQMARLTGHREIDLPLALRQELLQHFARGEGGDRLSALLTTVQPMTAVEAESTFGEALPPGLILIQPAKSS
jgi:molecular chaperone DnaK (HSP70)